MIRAFTVLTSHHHQDILFSTTSHTSVSHGPCHVCSQGMAEECQVFDDSVNILHSKSRPFSEVALALSHQSQQFFFIKQQLMIGRKVTHI